MLNEKISIRPFRRGDCRALATGRPKPVDFTTLKAAVWAHNGAGWIFCQRPQAASFLAARSAAAQEPWDELVDARGRLQIDEPGQDVDEICLRIDSGQLAVPTSSTMWVSSSILDAAHQRGKLDGSSTPVAPNHRLTCRRLVAQGTGYRRQRTLASARRVAKSTIPKKRREPTWTTTPSGFPNHLCR